MAIAVYQILKASAQLIGAIGESEELTAQETTDSLFALNAMLDSWSAQGLYVYQIKDTSFVWPNGVISRTIGPGGELNTARPTKIDNAFWRNSGVDYPIDIIDQETYGGIDIKATAGSQPCFLYFDNGVPLATLFLYPVPADGELHLGIWTPMQEFTTQTDNITFPPGYREAILYNLAIRLRGVFNIEIPQHLIVTAANAAEVIKRHNVRVPIMAANPPSVRRFNIVTGD